MIICQIIHVRPTFDAFSQGIIILSAREEEGDREERERERERERV